MGKQQLSVAILGTRGIPNRYGGFEACAEKLGLALVNSGHKVAVYCAHDHVVKTSEWQGISRIMIKNPEDKLGTFGQFIYDLNCNLHSRKQDYDIVLHLGYTSDSVWFPLWTRKSIHMVNMDGMEWKREKYNRLTRQFLRFAERMATYRANTLIADNPAIEDYLKSKYSKAVAEIPYGAEIPGSCLVDELAGFELEAGRYDLMVARTEPENNLLTAIEAKVNSENDIPLVIISNENAYLNLLMKKYGQNARIRFLGPVYDPGRLCSIRHFARYYVHGHSAGGTNPSLLEAMACESQIIAHRNPFNSAVLEGQALYFSDKNELIAIFLKHPTHKFVSWKEININKIRNKYNWEAVTVAYEQIFRNAIDHK